MPVNPNRATFVQQEYRSEVSEDLGVRATYPTAAELIHDTNLTAEKAAILADNLLAENIAPAEAYRVTFEGRWTIDEIVSAPPRFILEMPTYGASAKTFKTTKFEVDPFNDRTTVEVRK